MRYSICLSYDGSAFCGWQIQPHSPSVQEAVEGALSRLLGRPVAVTGAGRTDTSVNASRYVAHFEYDGTLPFEASDFVYKLNAILPRQVAVHSVLLADEDFHARFSARKRSYTYFIHRQKDPFVAAFSWQCGYPDLDFDAMNKACKHLLGTHDFSCFEKTGTDNKTSICTISEAFWAPYTPSHVQVMAPEAVSVPKVGSVPEICSRPWPHGDAVGVGNVPEVGSAPEICSRPWLHEWEGPAPKEWEGRGPKVRRISGAEPTFGTSQYWYFRVSADRFLRNMVRAIVGSLIEVGRGKHEPEWISELIATGTRGDAGESVPGHALFLNRVEY